MIKTGILNQLNNYLTHYEKSNVPVLNIEH